MKKMAIVLCAMLLCMCMIIPELAMAGCEDHPDAENVYTGTVYYTKRDRKQHKKVESYIEYCPVCYTEVESGGNEEWEDHTFDENGTCTECGYVLENDGWETCPDHPDAGTYYDADPVKLIGYDEDGHELQSDWGLYCAECNQLVFQGGDVDVYEHTFVDGTCTVCGYVRKDARTDLEPAGRCPDHPNASSYWGDVKYCDIYDKENHMYRTVRRLYCSECEQELDYDIVYEYEPHIFENGVCKICGYNWVTDIVIYASGGCELHPDASSISRLESFEYKSHGYIGHSINMVVLKYCTECGALISRESLSGDAMHEYVDRVCRYCGYVDNTPPEDTSIYYGRIGYSDTNIQRCVTKAFYHYTSMTPGGMIDGDPETSFHWTTSVEDERNSVPQFTFYLREQQTLSKMKLRNGNISSEEAYNENARLNYIKLEFYSNDKKLGSQEFAIQDVFSTDYIEYAFSHEYENVDEIRAYLQKKGTTYNGTKNIYDVYVTDIAFE